MKTLLLILALIITPIVSFSQVDTYQAPNYHDPVNQYPFPANSLASALIQSLILPDINHSLPDLNSYNLYKVAKERESRKVLIEQARAVEMMNIMLDFYDKQKKYPPGIPDGWHNVVAMNYSNICLEGKALVRGNEVTCFVIDNWEVREIKEFSPISACISSVELLKKKDNKSKKHTRIFDLYFIDYLIDPDVRTTPPVEPGKASFRTDPEVEGGTVILYVNGELKGEIDSDSDSVDLGCGEKGALVFKCAPGTYEFRAMNYENVWRGQITIYSGECTMQVLSKTNNTASGSR